MQNLLVIFSPSKHYYDQRELFSRFKYYLMLVDFGQFPGKIG